MANFEWAVRQMKMGLAVRRARWDAAASLDPKTENEKRQVVLLSDALEEDWERAGPVPAITVLARLRQLTRSQTDNLEALCDLVDDVAERTLALRRPEDEEEPYVEHVGSPEIDDQPRMSHKLSCGTAYRGCDPDCPFEKERLAEFAPRPSPEIVAVMDGVSAANVNAGTRSTDAVTFSRALEAMRAGKRMTRRAFVAPHLANGLAFVDGRLTGRGGQPAHLIDDDMLADDWVEALEAV